MGGDGRTGAATGIHPAAGRFRCRPLAVVPPARGKMASGGGRWWKLVDAELARSAHTTRALAEQAAALYAGEWRAEDARSRVVIEIRKGTLYAREFVLVGVDALALFGARGPLALRSSGRRDEFRCVLRS